MKKVNFEQLSFAQNQMFWHIAYYENNVNVMYIIQHCQLK